MNTGQQENVTIQQVLEGIDTTWERLKYVLDHLGPAFDAGPDEDGWTPRQVLSHLVGSWQRVPVHTAFFLTGQQEVPIVVGDTYWITEWEHAPLEAFTLAMSSAYEGNRVFIRTLSDADLSRRCNSPFGNIDLGQFLMISYTGHIGRMHTAQLAHFLS